MNKETFVAFATQKGGVGKSTVTALVANYIHNVMGIDVAVIDCDEPQHSIAGLRDKETALIEKNDSLKAVACEHFRKSGRKGISHRPKQRRASAGRRGQPALGERIPAGNRVLRPAGHAEKRRGDKDALADGLHLHARQCRPLRGGERVAVRDDVQRQPRHHRACQDERHIPVLDNGGRTGKDRAVRPVREAVRRKRLPCP